MHRGEKRLEIAAFWFVVLVSIIGFSMATFAQETSACTITVQPGESIQEAIDKVPEGAVICLAVGIWEESIKITKSLTLRGAGDEKTMIEGKTKYDSIIVIGSTKEDREILVEIEGVKITKGGDGIAISGDAEARITNCAVSGNNWGGIVLLEFAEAKITDCTLSENWSGIVLQNSGQAEIIGCTLSGNRNNGIECLDSVQAKITNCTVSESQSGIELSSFAWAEITDCTISGNWEYGIWLQDSTHLAMTGCAISRNKKGIMFTDLAQVEIRRNVIEGNTSCGIASSSAGLIWGGENRMRENGVDLHGNVSGTFRLPLVNPIEEEIRFPDVRYSSLQEAVDALIPGGKLVLEEGEYEAGVTIGTEIEITTVEGAKVTLRARSKTASVLSLAGGAVLRLAGVEVKGGYCGLSLGADARVEITGCIVSGNSWYGILLENHAQATITYCGISGNGLSGIMLTNFAQATITNCAISENEMDGIVLSDTVQVEITENRIVGNGKFGIGLYRKDCDYQYAPRGFTGHITGSGNFIPGRDEPGGSNWMALCPAYPGYPWPNGFLKE